MAALDFPASPTNGQVFSAPNGVTYIYSAAYTAWQAQPLSAGFVGDVCASTNVGADVAPPSINTWFTAKFPNLISGNAGVWYNTANGRYTPPKGRYRIFALVTFMSSSTNMQGQIRFQKNGVNVPTAGVDAAVNTAGANLFGTVSNEVVLDMNGTDYVEIQTQSNVLMSQAWGRFDAMPISPNANMTQGTGEFFTAFSATGLTGTPTTVLFPAAMTGNSGGWYNPANGRWTPPAGRYYVFSTIGAGHNAQATMITATLRKNGTGLLSGIQVPATANWYGDPSVAAILDMNGTDWVDIQGSCNNGSNLNAWCWFGAFPISGIKGPSGDVGQTGTNAFNVRATTNDTINGPNYISLFRTASAPVIDYDPNGVLSVLAGNTFFTAPNAGRYHFEAYGYTTSNPAGQAMLAIQHQTAAGAVIRTYASGMNNDQNAYGAAHRVGIDLQMAAGERIYFMLAANSGTCTTAASGTIGGLAAQALCYAFGHRII